MRPLIFAIIISALIAFLVWSRQKAGQLITEFVMDNMTKKNIDTLHPAIKPKAIELVKRADKEGINLRVTKGLRSYDEQRELFNYPFDGKDNNNNGIIDEPAEKVTNAEPGESFHNFALAFDVVPIINGKAIWDIKNPVWQTVGKLGESLGLEWGGRWKFVDFPHFQIMNFPLSHAQRNYNNKKIDSNGFILLT